MANDLRERRELIDAALGAGATKRSIARACGVTIGKLNYYLETRDLVIGKDDADIQAALARLAADAQG